jgi:hypothetical protein
MTQLKSILLADENLQDVKLTLIALEKCRVVHDVVADRNGAKTVQHRSTSRCPELRT